MSVKGCPDASKVVRRKHFIGDPAGIHAWKGPGTRKSRPEYETNLAKRRQEGPHKPSVQAHKGPTHRPAGVSREDWVNQYMNPRYTAPEKKK